MEVELRKVLILQSELLDAAIDRLGDMCDRFEELVERNETIVQELKSAFWRDLIQAEVDRCGEMNDSDPNS